MAGSDQFRLDELIRGALKERSDPREVITDSHSRYFGIIPSERTLLPDDDARLGKIEFLRLAQEGAQPCISSA